MFDFLLNEEEKAFWDEVRDFVKTVPSQLLRDMDAGKIETGRPFIEMAAARNLLGARFPKGIRRPGAKLDGRSGGGGRGGGFGQFPVLRLCHAQYRRGGG